MGVMAQELSQRSGQLVQVPNLKATWLLDEVGKEREGATRSCNFFCQETVLTCCHYAGEALSVAKAKEQCSIMLTCGGHRELGGRKATCRAIRPSPQLSKQSRVGFSKVLGGTGSENLERMGGLSVLLEFIGRCLDSSHRACAPVFTFWRGLICADAGAGYAAQLPFGLPEVGFFQGLAVSDGRLRSGGHGGVELLICAGSRSVSLWRFSRFGAINISPTVRCSFSGSVAGVVKPIASSYWGLWIQFAVFTAQLRDAPCRKPGLRPSLVIAFGA